MHVIAGKAVAFKEALEPEFKDYQKQIIKNAKVLSEELASKAFRIVSGGTDNHLMLVDLSNKNITGKEAEKSLDKAGITVNKNLIPFDEKSPFITSGIRIGTPAATTRGMGKDQMKQIAGFIDRAVKDHDNNEKLKEIRAEIMEMLKDFPVYKTLIDEMEELKAKGPLF